VTPYVDLSWQQASRPSYVERGGGFPAAYNGESESSTELRLGAVSRIALAAEARLSVIVEGVHRIESIGPRTSGQLAGLFAFDIPGQSVEQNWLRLGLGFDHPKKRNWRLRHRVTS
jgi:uncharacterized protein with beta-barrel porin domain